MFLQTSQDVYSLLTENGTNLDNMSTATRVTLIILTSLIILLGLLGNSFVLFASLKYRAIDIDRISILLIENLAAADLLIVVFEFIPMLITLIANDWILGDVVCGIQSYGRDIPSSAEIFLIMVIMCYRVHVVLNPPLVPIRMFWFHVFATLAWIIPGLVVSVGMLVIKPKPQAHFVPTQLKCGLSDLTNPMLDDWYLVLTGVTVAIPLIATIVANAILMAKVFNISRRIREAMPNRGAIVTILWVGVAFIISWVPTIVRATINALGGTVPTWGILFSRYCITINVVSNPIIYILSNRGFKTFVIRMLSRPRNEG